MSLVPCKHGSYDLDACLACAREETEAVRSTLNDVRRERLVMAREIEEALDLLTPARRENGLRDAVAQRMTELVLLRANVVSLEQEAAELRAKVDGLRSELDDSETRVLQLERENAELREMLKRATREGTP